MDTKAIINLREGYIELCGSEEFVSKYMDEFKDFFGRDYKTSSPPFHSDSRLESTKAAPDSLSSLARKESTPKGRSAKGKAVQVEKFDLHRNGDVISLEEFLAQKRPPQTVTMLSLIIGYYITHMKGENSFSEGQIDYAYKTLSLKGRPGHLRQILIIAKNEKDYFDTTEEGRWVVTRTGEIFVEEKMPPAKS